MPISKSPVCSKSKALQKNRFIINNYELDKRRTFQEIVDGFPYAKKQREELVFQILVNKLSKGNSAKSSGEVIHLGKQLCPRHL